MLDVFSDVGGLRVALLSGISVLLNIWNHNYLDSFIASKLFKSRETKESEDKLMTFTVSETLKKFCIYRLLPSKLICCQKNKKLIVLESACKALEKEVDIVKIIRSKRLVHIALKHLLLPEVYKKFKHQSRFTKISPNQSEPLQSADKDVSIELEQKFSNMQ